MMRTSRRRRSALSGLGPSIALVLAVMASFAGESEALASSPSETAPPTSSTAPLSALSAEDCTPPASANTYSLWASVQLGVLMPIGVGAVLSLPGQGKPRWLVDVIWEPSNYLQSYSMG